MLIKKRQSTSGFTLLEILLVVGIIAILAGIVIVAINPSKQLATVRNTERKSDIKQISNALDQYYIDHFHYPATTPSSLTEICDTGSLASSTTASDGVTSCGDLVNLSVLVPTYITAIPKDPQATTASTGYSFMQSPTTHKVVVKSLNAELGAEIAIGVASSTAGTGSGTLGNQLVAHYLMNTGAGGTTLADTKHHNGTSNNPISLVSHAGMGSAMSFDGGGGYVTVPENDDIYSNPIMSISFWFNSSNQNQQVIMSTGYYDGILISSYNNQFLIYSVNDNYAVLNPVGGFDGHWHFVTLTFNGTIGSIYIDGAFSQSTPFVYPSSTGTSFLIGYDAAYPTDMSFNGSLDDIRIYSRVLTSGEIAQLAAGTEAE